MNAKRRNAIEKILISIDSHRASIVDEISELEALQAAEQECFDNMPEGLQASDNGQRIEECATMLESAIATLQSALEDTEAALDEVREAMAQ